ncbi:MAG: hypothetical protein HYV09_07840 [Deltaproteobacteria bacterium]|nr:hypothetical protein [Deltaproteobacteria bacterium]
MSSPRMPWESTYFAKVPLGIVCLNLTPSEREVYRALAFRCWYNREDTGGYTVVSADQLSIEAGVSRKAAIKALAELRVLGLVDRVQLGPTEFAYALLDLPPEVFRVSEQLARPFDPLRTRAGKARFRKALERAKNASAREAPERLSRGREAPSDSLQ